MAIEPTRLETLDGVTVHQFADESWIVEAKLRAGSIRGRTRSASTNTADRAGRSPAWGGRSWSADQILVDYWLDPSVVDTHETNLQKLEAVFPQDDDDGYGRLYLVITEEGTEKRALVAPEQLVPSDQSDHPQRLGHFIGRFSLLDGTWYEATAASVAAASKTSSPATLSVTNGPAKSEEVTFSLQPTVAKSASNGQRFRRPVTIRWENPWPARQLAVDITGGGWNHAAEVTATRSDSTGKDVEVRAGDRRIMRWSAAWNTTTTKVWCVLDIPAARYWTMRGGTSFLAGATTYYSKEKLASMPPAPFYAWVDNEVIRVTAVNTATGTMTVVRGQRGTTDATHASNSKLYWLPATQMLDVVYGYTSIAADAYTAYVDDDYKPCINLSTSTNTSHVYDTVFQETVDDARTQARKPRAGSWYTLDVVDRGKDHQYANYVPYTGGIDPSPADDATCSKMGLGYRAAGAYAGHPLQTAWALRLDVGITDIEYDYYQSTQWPAGRREARHHITAIDRDGNRSILETQTNIDATPDSGTSTVALDAPAYEIRVETELRDYQPQEPDDGDGIETFNWTLTLDGDQAVSPLWGASREDIYEFGRPDAPATLANSKGKTLSFNVVVQLSDTLKINVGERWIGPSDLTGRAHCATGDWPWLPADTNDVTYTEAGIGTVLFGVSSYRRAWA